MLNTQDLTAFIAEMGIDRQRTSSAVPRNVVEGFGVVRHAEPQRAMVAACATL